jgi:hypothetical protein
MATTKKLVTSAFNIENAKAFLSTIVDHSAAYYVFAGRHIPYEPDDSILETPSDSLQSSTLDVYNNMIFGKRVTSSDAMHMINRNDWAAGTAYAMYDHEDSSLSSNNFHAVVSSGSYYHVYKCLDNNNNANSTVEPSGQDIAPFFSPVDGYMWKYMYTVSDAVYNKFKTVNYIPLVANASVVAGATPGTIEHINVDSGGRGYDNYIVEASFRSADIQIGGSGTTYGITDDASSLNDYYLNCIIKMTSGVAADEYRVITGYVVSLGQKKITLESAFTNSPAATDTYEIYPYVYVYGDGAESGNCIARALIDSTTGNSVYRVEVLDPGEGYRAAVALCDIAGVVDVTQAAVLRPIISPISGHGSDPIRELFASRVGISVTYSNTESGYISVANDFRQIGIIKNPSFDNVDVAINLSNTAGSFVIGEEIHQYRNIVLSGAVAVNLTSTAVVGTNTHFDTSLVAGDFVYITDGASRTFMEVAAVTNATFITLASNNAWTGAGTISLINSTPYGIVSALATGSVTVSNLNSGTITTETKLYGNTSYAIAQVNTAAAMPRSVSGVAVSGLFDIYVEMAKFVGSPTSANTAITPDEAVRVESIIPYTQPSARFHSWANSESANTMYLTNLQHIFTTTSSIINESNTVSFTLANKYMGDLVRDSGEILYLENVDPISRASNKSETIKVILEF